jgi:hypothetical protein
MLRLAPLAALAALLALFLPASGPSAASGTAQPALPPGSRIEVKVVLMNCPSWFGQKVGQVSGLRSLTLRQEVLPALNLNNLSEDNSPDTYLVCQWYSGRQLVVAFAKALYNWWV